MKYEPYVSYDTALLLAKSNFKDWFSKSELESLNPEKIYRIDERYRAKYIDGGRLYYVDSEDNMIFAPTIAMVKRWLREVHSIDVCTSVVHGATITMQGDYYFYRIWHERRPMFPVPECFHTPEEAEEAGIKKVFNEFKFLTDDTGQTN